MPSPQGKTFSLAVHGVHGEISVVCTADGLLRAAMRRQALLRSCATRESVVARHSFMPPIDGEVV